MRDDEGMGHDTSVYNFRNSGHYGYYASIVLIIGFSIFTYKCIFGW